MKIDARQFDEVARTLFAPVYPLIADQIIQYTGITSGTCLDVGCGPGYLGAGLATKNHLHLLLLYQSQASR